MFSSESVYDRFVQACEAELTRPAVLYGVTERLNPVWIAEQFHVAMWSPYCFGCNRHLTDYGSWTYCLRCKRAAGRLYHASRRRAALPFSMKVEITHAGQSKPYFVAEQKPSVSADTTVATVSAVFDRRDSAKTNHRYRKRVVKANGTVVKDVDVRLSNQAGHGNVGTLHDEPAPSVAGDPMYVILGTGPPRTPMFLPPTS